MKKLALVCGLALLAGCGTYNKENKMELGSFLVGRISESKQYEALHPRFAKAFEFLRRPDLATLPLGRYEIDGDNMWAMIQEAKLKPFGETQRTEVHGTYIDLQAPLTGPETIGFCEMTPDARAEVAFKADKDIALFDAKTKPTTLQPGEFALLVPPYGAHAPCRSMDGARTIKKLVIKIRK